MDLVDQEAKEKATEAARLAKLRRQQDRAVQRLKGLVIVSSSSSDESDDPPPAANGYNCAGDVVESLDIIPLDNVAGVDQLQYSARLGIRSVYGHGLLLQDSCDGLLLFSLYNTDFSIYTPTTSQYAPLQQVLGCKPLRM